MLSATNPLWQVSLVWVCDVCAQRVIVCVLDSCASTSYRLAFQGAAPEAALPFSPQVPAVPTPLCLSVQAIEHRDKQPAELTEQLLAAAQEQRVWETMQV